MGQGGNVYATRQGTSALLHNTLIADYGMSGFYPGLFGLGYYSNAFARFCELSSYEYNVLDNSLIFSRGGLLP